MGAKLFGIIHFPSEEKDGLGVIQKYFTTGKTLLVEHPTLYPQIVKAAKRAGMKVVSLDSKFVRKLLKVSRTRLLQRYVDYQVRERSWLPKVKHANEGDLVLVHPFHYTQLAKELVLSGCDFVFTQKGSTLFTNHSTRPSEAEVKAIEGFIARARSLHRKNKLERIAMLNSMPDNASAIRKSLKKTGWISKR